jgi:hypothetical protein
MMISLPYRDKVKKLLLAKVCARVTANPFVQQKRKAIYVVYLKIGLFFLIDSKAAINIQKSSQPKTASGTSYVIIIV